MPKITKVFEMNVTPERMVNSCDFDELQELYLLTSARLEKMMKGSIVKNEILKKTGLTRYEERITTES